MTLIIDSTPRILSVQSHVVSGYCGNKSATFPLQLLEFEVDVINSVQLSNHTQYQTTRGQKFGGNDLEQIHIGLKENHLLPKYDLVLSGYVADTGYITSMASLIKDIKAERKQKNLTCFYTLDPVLGDDGIGYYVPGAEKVAEAYKKNLIPLADIITPNRFEASILSGVEIDITSKNALSQTIEAINAFHATGIKIVVITSIALEGAAGHSDKLTCIVSSNGIKSSNGCNGESREIWLIRIPKIDQPFTGTGDLFAALFTGWLHKTNFDLKSSLEKTVNSIHEVLKDTREYYNLVNDGSIQSRELRLVQNKESLMKPSVRLQAEKFNDESFK